MGRKKHREYTPLPSPSTSSSSEYESQSSEEIVRRHHSRKRLRSSDDRSSRREKERRRERNERKEREKKDRKKRKSIEKKKKKRKNKDYDSESVSEDEERLRDEPESVVEEMLKEFPNVGPDLKQLLQMIDDGQAVDINGITERSLSKHLKKLFVSLNLKENGDSVFLLPSSGHPTLEVVRTLIEANMKPKEQQSHQSVVSKDKHSAPVDAECTQPSNGYNLAMPSQGDDTSTLGRRMIGPAMPSAELLAAAAKLTEAQAELSEAELEEDSELFIGPPPPAVVAEAESANEAEHFEAVTIIMGVEGDSPYDVVGVNQNMSADNIKKRYWKLSLLVHPDKCSHPQAHQAFIKLNKAFKELQDPEKRKVLDEKIKLKEEQEELKVELQAMREAAEWRRKQGISMEGDDELLAEMEVKVAPKRDEWMTTLPPERKVRSFAPSVVFALLHVSGKV
uniref:DNAJ heat shock N-terminal domain-containing family protein n=1 Tax=Rhizophora mucronata TaxID=61149 RepID=A0A2P2LXS4_RHIMU